LPSVSGFFISDFLWADRAVNQTLPFTGPFPGHVSARTQLAALQHRISPVSVLFLVRTVVIPSFTPYVKSDSPDSPSKSESFVVAAYPRAN
jgi:hypothetical protein